MLVEIHFKNKPEIKTKMPQAPHCSEVHNLTLFSPLLCQSPHSLYVHFFFSCFSHSFVPLSNHEWIFNHFTSICSLAKVEFHWTGRLLFNFLLGWVVCFFFLSCSFQNSLWVLMERLKCLQILLISAKTWSTLPHSSETHVPAVLSDVRNTQNRTFTKAAKYYLYTRDKYLANYSVQFLYWLSISIVESNIYDSLSCEVKGCFNITVPYMQLMICE